MQAATLNGKRPLDAVISSIAQQVIKDRGGEVATYIPELSAADPEWFGLALTTADGAQYHTGDSHQPFTIQSISKPFAYAMALEIWGHDEVRKHVGIEPSGEAFNSISLEPNTGRPLNPMINAGAIAVSSLIYQKYQDRALYKMLEWFSSFTGRELTIDERIYESESSTGHRNRAIAHLLRNFGIIGDPVEKGVDLYFKQCSILVTADDLSMMAATLANRGVNPRTGKHAMSLDLVDDMLSIMTTCGMYDYAGQWLNDVGLPAKSGVAGGILAVLPGRLGIGAFSPRLDSHGNSVRGVKVCQALSTRFRLHLFSANRPSGSVIRRHLTLKRRHSRHMRSTEDMTLLREIGDEAHIFELQGDLQFAGIEAVQRGVCKHLPKARYVILDFARVDSLDDVALEGLEHLIQSLSDHQIHVAISAWLPHRFPAVSSFNSLTGVAVYDDLEAAMEATETALLANQPLGVPSVPSDHLLRHDQFEIAGRMSSEELSILEHYLKQKDFPAETPIFRMGDPASHVYFLAKGTVAVRLPTIAGPHRCLARLSPGAVFGEMSAIDRNARSSDIWCESPVTCYSLSLADYDRLTHDHPIVKVKLLEYLVGVLTSRLRSANEQISALAV